MRKAAGLARAGWLSIACGILIFFAGGASALFAALVERINIGALQLWTLVLSVVLYSHAGPGVAGGRWLTTRPACAGHAPPGAR